jgi:hypothetical protein
VKLIISPFHQIQVDGVAIKGSFYFDKIKKAGHERTMFNLFRAYGILRTASEMIYFAISHCIAPTKRLS